METICIKVDKSMLVKMDKAIKKHDFGTRTEFVRTAIRKELKEMTREELVQEFMKFRGKASGKKFSWKEYRKNREDAYQELIKEKGWD